MKKIVLIIACWLLSSTSVHAQEYVTPPGLDKFVGTWQYFNGQDTIIMKCKTAYIGNEIQKVKLLFFYYNFNQGNAIIWNNINNFLDNTKGDFGGTKPFGSSLDTLQFYGKDNLKRKTDEGYIIINSAGTQITFMRKLGISGGGLNVYKTGEGPLPGFTLPNTFVLTKLVFIGE